MRARSRAGLRSALKDKLSRLRSEPSSEVKFSQGTGRFSAPVLITGGAGFIGSNFAERLLSEGQPVLIYDNLSRRGSESNLEWLSRKHGPLLQVILGDVRSYERLQTAVHRAAAVFHFAAQVAVTDSLTDPRLDFDVNVRGTVNVLEAIRATRHRPPLIFTSTNKVYGSLNNLA